MREIALFVEDFAHRQVIGALIQRLARESGIEIRCDWRSATGGHGKVAQELKLYLRDLQRQGEPHPDLIVAATDANCRGPRARREEIRPENAPAPMICAIPDPHIERWLLLDGAAFRAVLGRGCEAPDQKCERQRYKRLLIEAIRDAGTAPSLGGIEFAEDIVQAMDIDRAAQADRSFQRFVADTRAEFRQWKTT